MDLVVEVERGLEVEAVPAVEAVGQEEGHSLELEVAAQEEVDPTEVAQKVVQEKELVVEGGLLDWEVLPEEVAGPDQEVEDLVDQVGLEDPMVDVVESVRLGKVEVALLVLLAQEICPHQEQPLENGPVLYHLVEMLHVNCLLEDQLYLPQTSVLIV